MIRELVSLRGIHSGYILNLYGGPTGEKGNTIHPYGCRHWEQMKIPPRKVWGDSIPALEAWLSAQGGKLDSEVPTCDKVP
jgi:hypothetical protein